MIPFDESDEQLDTYFQIRYDDCRSKAEKLFSEKVPYIAYKVYGSSIECDSMYRYYPMTDETIEIIKKLQEPDPEQSISYLLETNGCDNLVKEFEGEDGFWVYTIDWTPRRIYSFSIVEYSKFSYKSSPKQEVFIYLEDEEYIQLLCNRIMYQDFNFNNLVAKNPELAQKIMSQLTEYDYPSGNHMNPFVLFMDEIEEDVKNLLGAPVFIQIVYSVNNGEREEISFFVSESGIEIMHTRNEDFRSFNVVTGDMSSNIENNEHLTDISFVVISQMYNETDPEILVNKLENDFHGESAFEDFRTFLDNNKISYNYKEEKTII